MASRAKALLNLFRSSLDIAYEKERISKPRPNSPMLVNYFLFLMTLLLFAGLALDTGVLEWKSMHTQQAADAAAQEAMYQLARNDSSWAAAGQLQATANGFTNGANGATVTITNPPTSGPWLGDSLSVQATVTQTAYNLFMGFVNGGRATIANTAIAKVIYTCIWIMNPSSGAGSSLWLASGRVTAPCGVFVNTASGGNLQVDGFSTLDSLRIRVVGPSSGNASSGSVYTQPKFGSSAKNDPLAYITAPTFSACSSTGLSISNVTYTASPGTYCGTGTAPGLTLNNSTLYLNPGLYIITGGLSMSNSYIYGEGGVTLYFTKGGGANYGTVVVNGTFGTNSSGIYLKAPTTSSGGSIPGIVVFGDRGWITHGSRGVQILYTQVTTDGIWYLPNTGLYLWISPFSFFNYNAILVDNLYNYGATATFHPGYANLGGVSPFHYEDGLLVQ
jgi:hypothetical protein